MKKIYTWLAVILCLCFTAGTAYADTVTVTDQAGRTVVVNQPVRRVVTTFIPATIFALCADLGPSLVGASNKDDSASIFEAVIDPARRPVSVGNRTVGLSLETIFSLKPDLVIMYGQKDGIRTADRLTRMGVPAIVIVPESLDGMAQTLDIIGRAAGKAAHTDKVVTAMRTIAAEITAKLAGADHPRVYYAGSSLLTTVSGDMLQNEMIRLAGGVNVSEDTNGFFVRVSREQLMSWDPQVMIASDRLSRAGQALLNTPEYHSISAVKNSRIFRVPARTYWDFPSPLAMAGVVWMAGRFNPEIFPADRVKSQIEMLYDTIFGPGFSRAHLDVTGQSGQ